MARTNTNAVAFLWPAMFWGFLIVKATGHIFAAWSWWWLLLPIVPWVGLAVKYFNL